MKKIIIQFKNVKIKNKMKINKSNKLKMRLN